MRPGNTSEAQRTEFTVCCERHWTDGGRMAPVTHPEIVNPVIARFLVDSAAYLGLPGRARECESFYRRAEFA